MKTYVLYHDKSEICKSSIDSLPEQASQHMDLVCVDNHPLSIPNKNIRSVMQEKKISETTKSPTVMYFDPSKNDYVRYDGIKALTFLHQYRTTSQMNKLRSVKKQMDEKKESVSIEAQNISRIMETIDSYPMPEHEKTSSLIDSIKQTQQIQLQKLYNKMHNMNPRQADRM